jgi:type IV fimbrial biogenesis protein FimT
MKSRSRIRGISLVELMTTVGIAAIALTLGVPAFTGVHSGMQRTQASMELIASFRLARSEAARRGVSITICPSGDGLACSTDPAPSWSAGWMVFTDLNENSRVDSATDTIVYTARFGQGSFSLTSDTAIAKGVLFSGSGFPKATGRYTYCDKTGALNLDLSYVGRIEQVATSTGCL